MKKGFVLVLAFALMMIMVTGCAHGNKVEKTSEIVLKATVVAVDHEKRIVTLRDGTGDVRDFKVGKEAVNLPQVKTGDIVTIRFYESMAVEVIKPGKAAAAGETTTIVRAKPGEMPGGAIARQTVVTATVKAIDKKAGTISLMGPNAKTVKVKVQDPANLEMVKIGDELMITYIEAEAISVDRAQ
jgi:NMD protein affecting ribosome stability and mRNA decay